MGGCVPDSPRAPIVPVPGGGRPAPVPRVLHRAPVSCPAVYSSRCSSRSSSREEKGDLSHCSRPLAEATLTVTTSGSVGQRATHVTCPAEAQVVGDVGQPLLHPLLRILLICTRSRTEWPWLSAPGEDPALTIQKGSHLSKQSMVAPLRYYPLHHVKCVRLASGMEWEEI